MPISLLGYYWCLMQNVSEKSHVADRYLTKRHGYGLSLGQFDVCAMAHRPRITSDSDLAVSERPVQA